MCEPATIAFAAVSIATAAYGYRQQKKATEAMAVAQQQQIDAQAGQKTQERMEEARALRAQARASAAEAGVSGLSVNLMLDDIMGQAGRDAALIEVNRKNGIAASVAETSARNRGATAEFVGTVGNTAAGAYRDYAALKIQSKNPGGG